MEKEEKEAAWGYNEDGEPRWPAAISTLFAVILYVSLPDAFITGPVWILPALVVIFLFPLLIDSWTRNANEKPWHRIFAIILIAILNIYNIISLGILLFILTHPHNSYQIHGEQLLIVAAQIWLTNVIVFGLWYWELDRGGPAQRAKKHHRYPDFLFPQMTTPETTRKHWGPKFLDYLYVSFTNATAFSPTDTLPLTNWAKVLMMIQSIISLITVALVAARAVNILS
ncbi:MAG: DUF1345 domain-containing protein [Candidatus Levyibacteriota bacterium]